MISSALRAGGRLEYIASLHLALAVLAVITTPITVELLARVLEFKAEVSSAAVARQVAWALLLPTFLGMLIRAQFPSLAKRVYPWLQKIAGFVFVIVLLLIISGTFHFLLKFDLKLYAAIVVMITFSLAVGQLLGPTRPEDRTALALMCATRNPGLAMLIASLNFPPQLATPILIPCLFISALPSML